MKALNNFDLAAVPIDKILLTVTTEPDYEMQRILIAEDWPDWGDYTVIEGGHCSCYGFDETKWDAISYTEKELKKVLLNWLGRGYGAEPLIAQLWAISGRKIA